MIDSIVSASSISMEHLLSGLIGSVIGVLASFGIAFFQYKALANENEKQRAHDRLERKKERDFQVEMSNYDRTMSCLGSAGSGSLSSILAPHTGMEDSPKDN